MLWPGHHVWNERRIELSSRLSLVQRCVLLTEDLTLVAYLGSRLVVSTVNHSKEHVDKVRIRVPRK